MVRSVVGRAFDRLSEEVQRSEAICATFARARELLIECDAQLFVREADEELAR